MNRCLGRRQHDPAAVAAAPALTHHYATEAPPPAALPREALSLRPVLASNDTCPTCSIAGLLNAALAVNALAKAGGLNLTAGCELPFYARLAGCAPTVEAIAATDGLNLLDVLRAQGNPPGFDVGLQAPLAGNFGTVPLDRMSLARVTANLGFVYLGVDLSVSDMDAAEGSVWQASPGDPSMGHCLVLWDYVGLGDTDSVGLLTWGQFQEVTWAWVEERAREAYAILFPDVQAAGVNLASLAAENAQWLTS